MIENNQIPREKIPWYPTIDVDLCIGDNKCLDFCPHGVYEKKDGLEKPEVKNPFNCIVACSNCVDICTVNAISFPSLEEITDLIVQMRYESKC